MEDTRIPIEELIDFPTEYSFKAVMNHTQKSTKNVLLAVQKALGDDRRVESRTRLSRNGTYISITATARLESVQELKTVYAALRKVEGLITVL